MAHLEFCVIAEVARLGKSKGSGLFVFFFSERDTTSLRQLVVVRTIRGRPLFKDYLKHPFCNGGWHFVARKLIPIFTARINPAVATVVTICYLLFVPTTVPGRSMPKSSGNCGSFSLSVPISSNKRLGWMSRLCWYLLAYSVTSPTSSW